MESKFHIGDKIKVIQYGHVIIQGWKGSYKAIDMCPQIIGQVGVIQHVIDTQGQFQYSVNGIRDKHAWYNEDQLELTV